jgi:hypothetical protein
VFCSVSHKLKLTPRSRLLENTGFQFFTTTVDNIVVLWVIPSCTLETGYQYLR